MAASIGTRVGYVYKTEDDLISLYNPGRPIEAYTVPFSFLDVGSDGISGTADDRTLTLLGVPTSQAANFPIYNVEQNTLRFSRYKTVEASMAKRQGNRWSAQVGGSYTWLNDFPGNYPNDPNGAVRRTDDPLGLQAVGQLTKRPWGIRLSPLLRHQAGAELRPPDLGGFGGGDRGRRHLRGHHLRRGA